MGLMLKYKTGTQTLRKIKKTLLGIISTFEKQIVKENRGFCTGLVYCLQIKTRYVSGWDALWNHTLVKLKRSTKFQSRVRVWKVITYGIKQVRQDDLLIPTSADLYESMKKKEGYMIMIHFITTFLWYWEAQVAKGVISLHCCDVSSTANLDY